MYYGYLIAGRRPLHLLKSKILQKFQRKNLVKPSTTFLNRLLFYDSVFSQFFLSVLFFHVHRLTKNVGFSPPKRIY